MTSDGERITGLWLEGQNLNADIKSYTEAELPVFAQTARWLDLYFGGKAPDFTPPLNLEGVSAFRRRVLEILLTIPYGKTASYGEIAAALARERGGKPCAQAVGGAVGRNPVAIIIPCHRVIGRHGALVGYAGGLNLKRHLLALERADIPDV